MNETPRAISPQQLVMMTLGLPHMAYIRPVSNGTEKAYVVCAADGTQLAAFKTEDAAIYAARQNDLHPVSIN